MFDRNLNMTSAFFICEPSLTREEISNIFSDDDKIKVRDVHTIHRIRLPTDQDHIETIAVVGFEDKRSQRLARARYDGMKYDFKEKGIHELYVKEELGCPVQ